MVGVENLLPPYRELGLGISIEGSLLTTESLNGKSLLTPPHPSDILSLNVAMMFIDDLGLFEEPADADLCENAIVTHRYENQMDSETNEYVKAFQSDEKMRVFVCEGYRLATRPCTAVLLFTDTCQGS